MKTRTLMFSLAAVMLVLLAVPFAVAQRMHHRGPGRMHGDSSMMMFVRLERAKEALGLSDQQTADIKKIFADVRVQNEPYRTSLRGGRQAIASILLANPNDLAGAQALIDKQSDAERQIKTNLLNAASKALNVLTPDQRAKAATILQQRMARNTEK